MAFETWSPESKYRSSEKVNPLIAPPAFTVVDVILPPEETHILPPAVTVVDIAPPPESTVIEPPFTVVDVTLPPK